MTARPRCRRPPERRPSRGPPSRDEIVAFLSRKWNREHASINDLPIAESDRKCHWPLGRRTTTTPA